jgi:hypothetical protein
VRLTRVRIARLAPGQDAQAWTHALEHLAPEAVRVLKGPRERDPAADRVLCLRLASREVVLKLRPLGPLRRRFRHSLGVSQLHRQWRGAELLKTAGVRTSEPLALGTLRVADRPYQWLATSFIPGPTLLHALAQVRGTPSEPRLAVAVGRFVAQLARAVEQGLFNRDLKPSNVMFAGDWHPVGPTPKLAIIDTAAIAPMPGHRSPDARRQAIARMFASLLIEPIGCGVAPTPLARRAALHAFIDAATARPTSPGIAQPRPKTPDTSDSPAELWHRVRAIIQAHGDPTPRINPLTPYEPRL